MWYRKLFAVAAFGLVVASLGVLPVSRQRWPGLASGPARVQAAGPEVFSAGVAALPPSPLQVTDVSPDTRYGDTGTYDPYGSDSGGRVMGLVVDPSTPNTIYAASEWSGIWKSTDGSRTWQWASNGLKTGITATSTFRSLAIDPVNPQRLLYASAADDTRVDDGLGGLWASNDRANSWRHIAFTGCDKPEIKDVAFSGARAYVSTTNCGLLTNNDLNFTTWTKMTLPAGVASFDSVAPARTAASKDVVFACTGKAVWRFSGTGVTGTWTKGATTLGGNCFALARVPDDSAVTSVLVQYASTQAQKQDQRCGKQKTDTWQMAVYPLTGALTSLGNLVRAGSGHGGIWAARRPGTTAGLGPGRSYDVFAADKCSFHQYNAGSASWDEMDGPHVDTFALATPPTYDPINGVCTTYVGNDGGVWRWFGSQKPCRPSNAGWRRAMRGLHGFGTWTIGGVSQYLDGSKRWNCPVATIPCPGLYAPSGDNATWSTMHAGDPADPTAWKPMALDTGCCGDTGAAYIDPALPTQVLTGRNGLYRVMRSNNSSPPMFGVNVGSVVEIAPPCAVTLFDPPSYGGIVQVMTLKGESPLPNGDYFAVQSPTAGGQSGNDRILRNTANTANSPDPNPCDKDWPTRTNSQWKVIDSSFEGKEIWGIAASGGHKTPTIYVLIKDSSEFADRGLIMKGTVSNGTVSAWSPASGTAPDNISRAYNMIADPYNPNVVYATDVGDNTIKRTTDGGQSWHAIPELKQIATNNGEYRFQCKGSAFDGACPLQHLIFQRDDPNLVFAVLFPGSVAFSRDGGAHWMPLVGATYTGIDRPQSAFYDPVKHPVFGKPSLYVGLQGRGVIRVDAPFPTLEGITFELKGLPAGKTAWVVDETTGVRTLLEAGAPGSSCAPGSYCGVELVDTAVTPAVNYHFEVLLPPLFPEQVRTARSSTTNRALSAAEKTAGVARFVGTARAATDGIVVSSLVTVFSPKQQTWPVAYSDTFGAAAIGSPSLQLLGNKGTFLGRMIYDTVGDKVCLLNVNSASATPNCVPHAQGGTLQNDYVAVDVTKTARTTSGASLTVNWTFALKDAVPSDQYTALATAKDGSGVGLAWQSLSKTVGITHKPSTGTLTPAGGFATPGTPLVLAATFADPDGSADLDTVILNVGNRVEFLATGNTLKVYDFVQQSVSAGCTAGQAVVVSKAAASIDCKNSSVESVDADTRKVTWAVTFQPVVSPKAYAEFLQARDNQGGDTGTVSVGKNLVVDFPPVASNGTPTTGSQTAGSTQTFGARFSDRDGGPDLATGKFVFTSPKFLMCNPTCHFGSQTLELYYFQDTGKIGIGNNGSKTPASCTPGATHVLTTTLGSLDCKLSTAQLVFSLSGSYYAVNWRLTPAFGMGGFTYSTTLSATDSVGGAGSAPVGTWTVNK